MVTASRPGLLAPGRDLLWEDLRAGPKDSEARRRRRNVLSAIATQEGVEMEGTATVRRRPIHIPSPVASQAQ